MAKQTTSFRLSGETQTQLGILSQLFRESGGEIVERAIKFLYDNREAEVKRDLDERISATKESVK